MRSQEKSESRRLAMGAALGRNTDPAARSEQLHFPSDEERLRSFARAIDALREDVEAQIGPADITYMERVCALSQTAEVLGRSLIHFSLDPFTFGVGVGSLWVHKTLELMEIGHTVLHGTYDKRPGGEKLRSHTFRWKAPIHERSWMMAHNIRHHQYTNIAGRDPDLDFGGLRLSGRIPHRALHRLQPLSNVVTWLGFATAVNLHATGLIDVYYDKDLTVLADRSGTSIRAAHAAFLQKFARYYAREYLLFPLLAGPFFWKVALGNALSDMARDVWAAAIIYCGHVGASDYAKEERAGSRAAWYAMQVEAAYDVDVPHVLSVLCGALDKQIEHHLFPRVPPNRLREIAPRVRAICEQHGVQYRSGSWPRRLGEVLGSLAQLSRAA
jgi:fatty acid desaturase